MKPLKPFDLEEALKGKVFVLRNGYRGIIKYAVDDIVMSDNSTTRCGYVGYILTNEGFLHVASSEWNAKGKNSTFTSLDAIGMYEEPELTQEELFEKALKEKLPLRYKGLDEDYANVYVVAKSMSGSYILEWEDGTDTCVSILSNLPEFEWYLASEKPVKETGSVGLPRPFIPKKGEEYYSISSSYGEPACMRANYLDHYSIQNGNCFRTKTDAQKWIDFMKSQIEE